MSPALPGAIATALAVTCLVLAPFGSQGVWMPSMTHPERFLLREVGWRKSSFAWECLRAIVIVCGFAIAGSLGTMPVGIIGAAVPSIVLRNRAAEKRDERARQTVTLLQLTLAGLRSGASLAEALRLATRSGGQEVVLGPFVGAVRAFDLGAPLDVAMREARAQARDDRVILGLDAISLCVAEQLPASRAATLIASAVDRLVFEQRVADDLRARTSGVRVQIALLAALVPGLALYLAITVPGMRETFTMPLGRFLLLPLAAILETAGILASRRVVGDLT